MHVIICGGGIIGASTAYFLCMSGARVTIVERKAIACAASGKSGGFLALDWNDHSPLSMLARRSFEVHEQLARLHAGKWGYRRVETLSVATSALRSLSSNESNGLPQWISESAALQGRLGAPETTAQVNPADFTRAMAELATDIGAQTIIGEVDGIDLGPTGNKVSAVCVNGEPFPCDSAVIAMGPWSNLAREWLPLPPVYGLKGNSIVFRTAGNISAHALFADVENGDGELLSPEIYPRPDGTVYVCGLSSQEALPADPESVVADRERIQRLRAAAIAIAPCLAEAAVIAEQACFRPVSRDGLPLIGRVENVEGAFIATGHSVWGILNAPATGEAMAQLILKGASDIDLSSFHPGRVH